MNYLTNSELKPYGSVGTLSTRASALVAHQCAHWPLASVNYASLLQVTTRTFNFGVTTIVCQHNPGRIRSSDAKTDSASIAARPCFLCAENRPSEQGAIPFGRGYSVLCNPFPIFPLHLTLASQCHEDQCIIERIPVFLRALKSFSDFVVFYNGPATGASAPDHFHFQAGSKGAMPLEDELDTLPGSITHLLCETEATHIFTAENSLRRMLVFRGDNPLGLARALQRTIGLLPVDPHGAEPMMNLLGWFDTKGYTVVLFPRSAQRPYQYFAEGDDRLLVSPATVELGGLIVLPRKEDFLKITKEDLRSIYHQVTLKGADFMHLKERILSWK